MLETAAREGSAGFYRVHRYGETAGRNWRAFESIAFETRLDE